jgi:hypothetical protein
VERDFVHFLQRHGVEAARVPNSGNSPYSNFKGDVIAKSENKHIVFELKSAKKFAKYLHKLDRVIRTEYNGTTYYIIPYSILGQTLPESIPDIHYQFLHKWLQQSNRENAILVLKENYHEFLFVVNKEQLEIIRRLFNIKTI